jgi:hypothetical protein
MSEMHLDPEGLNRRREKFQRRLDAMLEELKLSPEEFGELLESYQRLESEQSGLDESNAGRRDAGELLQVEIAEHFMKLRNAGKLEQRQLERWLDRLKKSLFLQLGFDLDEGEEEELP